MRKLTVVDAIDLANAYAAARYGVRVGSEDIPLRVGHRASALEACWPARSYAFITAWNPASAPRPDAANHAADTRLVARLDELGLERQLAWAEESADGQWHEPGWLVAQIDDATANQLGIAFGQAAILVWKADQPVRLRMLTPAPCTDTRSDRDRAAELAASVQWIGDQRDGAVNA